MRCPRSGTLLAGAGVRNPRNLPVTSQPPMSEPGIPDWRADPELPVWTGVLDNSVYGF